MKSVEKYLQILTDGDIMCYHVTTEQFMKNISADAGMEEIMKIKKTLCLVLAMAMMLMLAACGDSEGKEKASDLKIGCIMLGDETEGYTAAHINGIKAAAEELGTL